MNGWLPSWRRWSWTAALVLALTAQAAAFPTGELLALKVEPATIRQGSEKKVTKVHATVLLKEAAPMVFICKIRSEDGSKLAFSTIIFPKGAYKETSEGSVTWKNVAVEKRIRLTAYNADAPDRQLSFTVTLIPTIEPPSEVPETPTNQQAPAAGR